MEHMHRIGKLITIGAIAATVVAMLMMYVSALMINVSAPMLEPSTGLGFSFSLLILTCGQLYAGSNWARWIVGSVLVLVGALWSYQAITTAAVLSYQAIATAAVSLTAFRLLFVGVAIFALVFGISVLTAGHVKLFLAHQKTNPDPFARRVLRALWLLAGLAVAVGVVRDIETLLR